MTAEQWLRPIGEQRRERRDGSAAAAQGRHGEGCELQPAPICRDWIIEGNPLTRSRLLSGSSDDMAFTALWDCTAGRFHWYYDIDETICVLEGAVVVVDPAGQRHSLQAMDTFYFPAGSRYEWTVPAYVRKIAFVHVPLSPKLLHARRLYQTLKSWLPGAPPAAGPTALLGGG